MVSIKKALIELETLNLLIEELSAIIDVEENINRILKPLENRIE